MLLDFDRFRSILADNHDYTAVTPLYSLTRVPEILKPFPLGIYITSENLTRHQSIYMLGKHTPLYESERKDV